MLPPNTARPTTTVSMPVSRMPASQPTNPASPPDSIQTPTSPPVSSSGGAVLSRPAAANGPTDAASEMICVVTTTMAVNPSVARGLARM
jgi:hypothetical protein